MDDFMSNTYSVYCPLSQKVFKEKKKIQQRMNDCISNMRTSHEYLLKSTNDYVPVMQTICDSDPKGLYGKKKKYCTAHENSNIFYWPLVITKQHFQKTSKIALKHARMVFTALLINLFRGNASPQHHHILISTHHANRL
jgi:hypothetical protein